MKILILLTLIVSTFANKNCFFNIKFKDDEESIHEGIIDNSRIDSKDCVLLFNPIPRKKLILQFQFFDPVTHETDR